MSQHEREEGVDLMAEDDRDPVPEWDLEEGDVVRMAGAVRDELGVVVAGPPGARVSLPESALTVRAESGPVVKVLDEPGQMLGADKKRQYHFYRRGTGQVVLRNVEGEVLLRRDLAEDDVGRWIAFVAEERGWVEHRHAHEFREWGRR